VLRRHATARRRHAATVVAGLLVAAALHTVLQPVSAVAGPADTTDPGMDYFVMPRVCEQPGTVFRQHPHGCRLTRFVRTRPTVVLWGDSHARQQLPALVPMARKHKVNLVAFTMGGCPPAHWRIEKPRADYPGRCHESNALALRYAKKMARGPRPFLVVLGSNWAGFRDYYRRLYVDTTDPPEHDTPFVRAMVRLSHRKTPRLFPALARAGVRTVAVSQAATVPEHAPSCAAGEEPYVCDLHRRSAILHEGRTRRWLKHRMEGLPGRRDLVDVNGAFCTARACKGRKRGIYTFSDDMHLSATRVYHLRDRWRPVFRNLRR
jgi:hypothetical protein